MASQFKIRGIFTNYIAQNRTFILLIDRPRDMVYRYVD